MNKDILDAIGNTPMVEAARLSPKPAVRIFAKLEGQNLGGSASVKDRIAKYMVEAAERNGELTGDKTILEASSGNTGIALAMVGRRKGYRVKIVFPDNASLEKRQMLQLYGAEMVLTEGAKGVNWSIEVAREMVAQDASYIMLDQFSNPANPLAHYETTGQEILEQLADLNIDAFVCGIGTGGTLTGVGWRLRERNPKVRVIGVEPHLDETIPGLRSLSAGFIPPTLDLSLLDQRVIVRCQEAMAAVSLLLQREGIFAGLSSGAAVHQAIQTAREMERGNIVVVLPDAGWKYLSLGLDIWTWQPSAHPGQGTANSR